MLYARFCTIVYTNAHGIVGSKTEYSILTEYTEYYSVYSKIEKYKIFELNKKS